MKDIMGIAQDRDGFVAVVLEGTRARIVDVRWEEEDAEVFRGCPERIVESAFPNTFVIPAKGAESFCSKYW